MKSTDADSERRTSHQRVAAEHAVAFVRSGMVIGLGTGRTANFAVRKIGEWIRDGRLRNIVGVPTSKTTATLARQVGVPLTTLEDHARIDLTIDGADEVDIHLNMIKGAGGALLREKVVAQASEREIIVVDDSKLSSALGSLRTLPVEVIAFGWRTQVSYLEELGAKVQLRRTPDGNAFESDQGNFILDCAFGPIADPERLASQLAARAGIVEHGLFMGQLTDLISAGDSGIRHSTRDEAQSRRT
jgi:ribose 5-phosphate isomerase A